MKKDVRDVSYWEMSQVLVRKVGSQMLLMRWHGSSKERKLNLFLKVRWRHGRRNLKKEHFPLPEKVVGFSKMKWWRVGPVKATHGVGNCLPGFQGCVRPQNQRPAKAPTATARKKPARDT